MRSNTETLNFTFAEELGLLKAHFTEKRNNIKRQLAVAEWSSQVNTLAFVRGMTEIENRLEFGVPIAERYAIELWHKLQTLHEISPYLPQSAIVLALKLAKMTTVSEKKVQRISSYVSEFTDHYNEYLELSNDKHALATLPRHFTQDAKNGLNIELLQLLVEIRAVSLVATLLTVFPVPETAPVSLITDLIELQPELMTSKLAASYTPTQAVLAVSKLAERASNAPKNIETLATAGEEGSETRASDLDLLSTLLLAIPTRHYDFEHPEKLFCLMHRHIHQSNATDGSKPVDMLARLFSLIQPISLSLPSDIIEQSSVNAVLNAPTLDTSAIVPGFVYALLARHFASTSQHANLHKLLSTKDFNLSFTTNEELVALLQRLTNAHMRRLCFSILNHLPAERMDAIKEQTIFKWAKETSLVGNELASFIQEMSVVLSKFNLQLPMAAAEKIDETPSAQQTTTQAAPQDSTQTSSALTKDSAPAAHTSYTSSSSSTPSFAGRHTESQRSTDARQETSNSTEAEKERTLLVLTSRVYDFTGKAPWSSEDRQAFIAMFRTFNASFASETPLGVWATYFMCLRDEIGSDMAGSLNTEFISEARRFENFFLERRPKLKSRDADVLAHALTTLGQHLWVNGKHSAAMSIANIMSYYKLRSNRDFEVLVREQASPIASVSGVSPLSWLRNTLKDSSTDATFFNALPGFLTASLKFNVDELLAYSKRKANHEGALTSRGSFENSAKFGNSGPSLLGSNFQVEPDLEKHIARASEVWEAILPVWKRAKEASWTPTSEFASQLLRIATLMKADNSFFIDALKYLRLHHVVLSSSDFPLLEVFEALMKASATGLGNYLLSSSGLNLLPSLPTHIAKNRQLCCFIMRCLASSPSGDLKSAAIAYRLFSSSHDSSEFSSYCHQLLDSYYSVCASRKTYANAEKLMRMLLPIHESQPAPLYAMTIELAGQCGELSSAIRLYHEAQKSADEIWEPQLAHTILRAVTACNVLPIEAQRLRNKFDNPAAVIEEVTKETDSFLASLSASELTRRSRSAYISL